jgi:hypothetical protein
LVPAPVVSPQVRPASMRVPMVSLRVPMVSLRVRTGVRSARTVEP